MTLVVLKSKAFLFYHVIEMQRGQCDLEGGDHLRHYNLPWSCRLYEGTIMWILTMYIFTQADAKYIDIPVC